MPSPSEMFTELVTTTMREHPSIVSDNVSNHNALYNQLVKKKKIKKALSGGYEIALPLAYQENATFQRYSGYDTFDIKASDVLSAAHYEFAQAVVSVTASGRELRANKGKYQMINLVKERIKNAKRTADNNLSVDIYSTGSLPNQIGGLSHIIQDNGLGIVGGIDASKFGFWKNKFLELDGSNDYVANPKKLVKAMHELSLDLVRGSDKTDLIVATKDFYSSYWEALSDHQRYTSNDAPATFKSVKFQNNVDVIYDDVVGFGKTDERMYFLNTDYLDFYVHPDANWTPLDEKQSINQDAIVISLIWQGQLTCSNRSLQGVLIDAS